jgi:hypothetical protein
VSEAGLGVSRMLYAQRGADVNKKDLEFNTEEWMKLKLTQLKEIKNEVHINRTNVK